MAIIRQYPIATDTLPAEVGDAYETLLYELSHWLSAPSPFPSDNLVDYFEHQLAGCGTPENRIKYLCWLSMRGGVDGEAYPLAAAHLKQVQGFSAGWQVGSEFEQMLFIDAYYFSWLAVRLMEAVCELAGSSKLRGARTALWAEWEATEQHYVAYQTDYLPAVQVLKYLFRVLVPFVRGSRTQSIGSIAEQIRRSVPRPTPGPRPPAPPPEPLPQTLQMLCQKGLIPADVRDLLAQLGAVDGMTGRWHLGELTGKAAKPKSAFPAAYRALADLGLMRKLDGPVWLKIFVAEFDVSISPRMANYDTKGQVSKAFHEYYDDTVRWAKVWRAKREAEN